MPAWEHILAKNNPIIPSIVCEAAQTCTVCSRPEARANARRGDGEALEHHLH